MPRARRRHRPREPPAQASGGRTAVSCLPTFPGSRPSSTSTARSVPRCTGSLHRIGEDVSERLDIVPAQLRVIVVRRPRYACRSWEDVVVQPPARPRLIEGGLLTDGAVAQVLVAKYADHLPLNHQAQIYRRQGDEIDRSTLADWVSGAAFLLRPAQARLLERPKQSP